jgi:flavin-dependent dehydrogenase
LATQVDWLTMAGRFDAVVVGASIAGCTAAILLGRRGLRVALLERASDPRAYKKTCTHYIQACATQTIDRLGLVGPLEAAGAVRNGADMCTRFGWIRDPGLHYGYSVRRETLDPMLRDLAAKTDGVEVRLGHPVRELRKTDGRVSGVVAESADGARVEIDAPLVVAADGRHGKLAEMAGIPAKLAPNGRFIYLAYYRIPERTSTRALVWFRDPSPDASYIFPNDGGVTCVTAMPAKDKIPAFRADLEGSFRRMFDGLPEAPDLSRAERVSDFHGMLEIPNHVRRASAPGIAFVGDAAMTSDPLFGVGCGWAFQTSEWLADDVGDALANGQGLDEALDVYARHHTDRLRTHHELLNQLARAEPFDLMNRLALHAAASDEGFARKLSRLSARLVHPREVMTLGALAQMFWLRGTRKAREPAMIPPAAS